MHFYGDFVVVRVRRDSSYSREFVDYKSEMDMSESEESEISMLLSG